MQAFPSGGSCDESYIAFRSAILNGFRRILASDLKASVEAVTGNTVPPQASEGEGPWKVYFRPSFEEPSVALLRTNA